MRRRAAAIAAVLLLLPLAAAALEVAGVSFPPTVQAGGKTLTLNGAGLRTRFLFKVYAIGLYLEHPSTDARAILAADQVRRAELHMLRTVSGSEMGDAIATAVNANAGSAAAQLKPRVDQLKGMFRSANEGEVITLTYIPGKGTVVGAQGRDVGTIEGKDFADALFGAWIGTAPVDGSLKQALLAGGA
jgi:Chalcone isomerase-like